ncbi:MAG TPA: hypothetical protein VF487_01385 [Chitinophagaceae bacterium]
MKKVYLLLLLLAALSGYSQSNYKKISENYYRSVPFDREFSKFLNHLMNDPTIINKKVLKRTDSTLFYLKGSYTTHNPFFFKSIRTDVILAEREEIVEQDSIKFLHTVYAYQLIGYAPPGEEGMKEVKNEFEKFCRHYKKGYFDSKYHELNKDEKETGEVRDYSFKYLNFFPLTVAWATYSNHNNNLFTITIRFKVINNIAYLPESPDGF